MAEEHEKRKAYPSDLTDAQWAIVEPWLPAAHHTEEGGRPRELDLREVLNTLLYLNRSGCQWDMLPHDLLAKSSVYDYFAQWRDEAAGIEKIYVDPGIGFGKTFEHNLELLAHCERFTRIAPVVIGASRKAFIGHLTGQPSGPARKHGSLAAVAAAHRGKAAMVRVHDVRETVDFLKVLTAIEERRG